MTSFIQNIIQRCIRKIVAKEPSKLLGRWNIDYCNRTLDKKVDLSNEDHCGPCGQYMITSLQVSNAPPTSAPSDTKDLVVQSGDPSNKLLVLRPKDMSLMCHPVLVHKYDVTDPNIPNKSYVKMPSCLYYPIGNGLHQLLNDKVTR